MGGARRTPQTPLAARTRPGEAGARLDPQTPVAARTRPGGAVARLESGPIVDARGIHKHFGERSTFSKKPLLCA